MFTKEYAYSLQPELQKYIDRRKRQLLFWEVPIKLVIEESQKHQTITYIKVSSKLKKSDRCIYLPINSIRTQPLEFIKYHLIHELCHLYLVENDLDYKDGTEVFEKLLLNLGNGSSNYTTQQLRAKGICEEVLKQHSVRTVLVSNSNKPVNGYRCSECGNHDIPYALRYYNKTYSRFNKKTPTLKQKSTCCDSLFEYFETTMGEFQYPLIKRTFVEHSPEVTLKLSEW